MSKYQNANKLIGLFILASIFEIASFYFLNKNLNLAFKIFPTSCLFYYYYRSTPFPKKNFDKFLLVSIIITFLGEISFTFTHLELFISITLILYLIEHQIYISLVRSQRKGVFNFGNKDFFKSGWPYLIFAFFFFGFFLMEIVPDSFFFLVIIYVFQLAVLGVFSILISSAYPGKKFLLWGIVINIISDVLSSIYLFQGHFYMDYLFIRSSFLLSKILIIIGFVEGRKHLELKYSKI